jgi:hypothetical protein
MLPRAPYIYFRSGINSTADVTTMSHGMATGGLLAQHMYLIKVLSYCVLTFSLADLAESSKM